MFYALIAIAYGLCAASDASEDGHPVWLSWLKVRRYLIDLYLASVYAVAAFANYFF